MAKKIKVQLDHKGSAALLKSQETQDDLLARAGRVQDGANEGIRDAPADEMYQADVMVGKTRARASVGTGGFASMHDNSRNNTLLKNLGRGS